MPRASWFRASSPSSSTRTAVKRRPFSPQCPPSWPQQSCNKDRPTGTYCPRHGRPISGRPTDIPQEQQPLSPPLTHQAWLAKRQLQWTSRLSGKAQLPNSSRLTPYDHLHQSRGRSRSAHIISAHLHTQRRPENRSSMDFHARGGSGSGSGRGLTLSPPPSPAQPAERKPWQAPAFSFHPRSTSRLCSGTCCRMQPSAG